MGAILDAAIDHYGRNITIADPFSGGGTVTFEAARRGARVYAQDVFPWPARGLAAALQPCGADELSRWSEQLLAALDSSRAEYLTGDGTELSHVLRVRTADCLSCGHTTYKYPSALVSLASRSPDERFAFFGCRSCGAISKRNRHVKSFTCGGCGEKQSVTDSRLGCAHCSQSALTRSTWHPFLVQELVEINGQLRPRVRPVENGDPVSSRAMPATWRELLPVITAGKETNRLVDGGFERWSDLYSSRQIEVLQTAVNWLKESDIPAHVRDRLAFIVLGAAEMPAYLSRWDRFNLKAFEGMANHRYTQSDVAVETNLLSPIGRGTLPRRLRGGRAALQWLIDACDTPPRVVQTQSGTRGRKRTDWDILITTGSSVRQELQRGSVNVVLTDPPYFDDVQYGELSRLFHAWLKVYDPGLAFNEQDEAVPNSTRGTTAVDYTRLIAACLSESRRTLTKGGSLLLTFHNKKLTAWKALASAIREAGFHVKALAVVKAENSADHCKREVAAMLHDLVLECQPTGKGKPPEPTVEFSPRSCAEKNLVAVGLAMARCIREGGVDRLPEFYREHVDALPNCVPLIK